MKKNYYQILGLKPNATSEEIKRAYRLYATKFHPDKQNGDEFFEERFKEVQEAYSVLSDEIKRKKYDLSCFIGMNNADKPNYQTATSRQSNSMRTSNNESERHRENRERIYYDGDKIKITNTGIEFKESGVIYRFDNIKTVETEPHPLAIMTFASSFIVWAIGTLMLYLEVYELRGIMMLVLGAVLFCIFYYLKPSLILIDTKGIRVAFPEMSQEEYKKIERVAKYVMAMNYVMNIGRKR